MDSIRSRYVGFKKNRFLVTGASGFIGYHLAQKLVDLGGEVYCLSRNSKITNTPVGCIPVSKDLVNMPDLRSLMSDIKPQFIFHLAGIVSTNPDFNLVLPSLYQNVVGTVNLLVSLNNFNCKRFIYVGTSEEFGKINGSMLQVSPYMASKSAVKNFVELFKNNYGFPITTVRPFLVYGPRQNELKLIPYIILSLLRSDLLHIYNPNRICDMIYIKDAVDGLIHSCFQESAVGQEVDLGTGVGTSIKALVSLIFKAVDPKRECNYTSDSAERFLDPLIANIEKTKEILKWAPHYSLSNGLDETISWYKSLEKVV